MTGALACGKSGHADATVMYIRQLEVGMNIATWHNSDSLTTGIS